MGVYQMHRYLKPQGRTVFDSRRNQHVYSAAPEARGLYVGFRPAVLRLAHLCAVAHPIPHPLPRPHTVHRRVPQSSLSVPVVPLNDTQHSYAFLKETAGENIICSPLRRASAGILANGLEGRLNGGLPWMRRLPRVLDAPLRLQCMPFQSN